MEKEKTQTTNIRNEREGIVRDPMEIKSIIKGYPEQLCAHRFDNLDETDHERHSLENSHKKTY